MSQAIFNAIAVQDIEALENCLENGASPIVANEDGVRPLHLVASLIKKSFEAREYEEEDMYKKMAAILIVHGAPEEDLHHDCGEVSNLCHHLCRYIIDRSIDLQTSLRVVDLIEAKRLWFNDDDKDLEEAFIHAIERGDKNRVDEMFDNGDVHYTYEQ